ncbi:MAG: VWA domain-containing protein [Rhodoglobus sp.]
MSTLRRRHRATFLERVRRHWLVASLAVIAVIALIASGVQFLGGGGPLAALVAGCSQREVLVVVADPSIAPALTTVAEDFDGDRKNCATTQVRSQDSADTAALLASGAGGDIDAWVPDSSMWLDRTASVATSLGRTAPKLKAGDYLASTPVVLAAPASRASDFSAEPLSWATLLTGTVGAVLPNPEFSAASLAGLSQIKSVSSPTDPRQFAGVMIELGKSIPESSEKAFVLAAQAATPTVVITTEREVAAHNTSKTSAPLVALYPSDGTVALDYPFIGVQGGSVEPVSSAADSTGGLAAGKSTKSPAASKLLAAFSAAARSATSVFVDQGFRNADGGGELAVAGVLESATAVDPAAEGAVQLEILRAWSVLTLRSRLLVVVDVSGSMLDPASNGLRRIDVFQVAAGEALAKFSGEAELGVWVFSQNRVGTQDWEDLAPIAPLSDPAHVQNVNGIVGSLPARAYGATGLYDTVLAAVMRVKEEYDPSKINSVLLITDGQNEDSNGIDLPTLLNNLKAIQDPARPVPVILIGFGPDTDLESMTQIAQTTGGAAYSAAVPEDLGTVLVDALSQRACRPNCS